MGNNKPKMTGLFDEGELAKISDEEGHRIVKKANELFLDIWEESLCILGVSREELELIKKKELKTLKTEAHREAACLGFFSMIISSCIERVIKAPWGNQERKLKVLNTAIADVMGSGVILVPCSKLSDIQEKVMLAMAEKGTCQ